jgi:protein ImuB
MPRIACLFVPDLPLAALWRAEPDLHGRALVTVGHEDSRAPLTAVSVEAQVLGVRVGLSVAEARTISDALIVRHPSADVLRSAEEALCDVADSFSPRVENAGGGVVFLEIDGLRSLFGTESHLATSLIARLKRVGLEGRVAVASTKTVAWLAARTSEGVDVVPDGRARQRLGPLPVSLLGPPDDVALTLERWGIRTLGQLAALPVTAVGWRFGEAGTQLWKRATGNDEGPLVVRSRPRRFEETIDCGYAIDSFEPLSFLLRTALERLTARLDICGLRAGDLRLALRLAGGGHEEHVITVAAPTNEVKALLALARLHFERRPPRAPVEWFRLAAVAERLRPIELDLFMPAGPSPQDLDAAIARLTAIAGAGRVGSPAVLDSHRPEAFAFDHFALTPPARARAEPDRNPKNGSGLLALRAFRPPASIEVVCDRGRPDFVRGSGETAKFGGRVVTLAGPWRLAGEWWREASFARDYYDAELSDGGIYRIYRERGSGEWFADGVYD